MPEKLYYITEDSLKKADEVHEQVTKKNGKTNNNKQKKSKKRPVVGQSSLDDVV